mgnify:CR=1 FL=1
MNERRQAIKALEENGYHFEAHGKNHDQYYNKETRYKISLKRHDFDQDDLRLIKKEIKKGTMGRS